MKFRDVCITPHFKVGCPRPGIHPVRRHTPPPIPTRTRPPPAIPFSTRPTFSLPTVPVAVSTPVPSTLSSVNYWYDDDVPRLIGWVPPVQIPFAGAEPENFPGQQELPTFAAPTNNTDRLTNIMEQMVVMFNNQQAFQHYQMNSTNKPPPQPKKYIAVP